MILVGALIIGVWQAFAGAGEETWKGLLMFLTGSGLWAIHSVVFNQSSLSPLHGLVIGLFWGALFVSPLLI